MKNRRAIDRIKGFTLAEVLITLGIIGVIASITIPTLLANNAKQENVEILKKSYTILSQEIKLSQIDNDSSQYWDWGDGTGVLTPRQSFDKYWAPYLKIAKYCSSYSDCGYNTNFLTSIDHTSQISIINTPSRTSAMLIDGTLLLVINSNNIILDINAGKGPNIWGKDVFFFVLDPNMGIMPKGYDHSVVTVNSSCATGSDGEYCAAKIIRDSWQIKDDYPW